MDRFTSDLSKKLDPVSGGALDGNTKAYCGIKKVPQGRHRGDPVDCKNQIRYWGINEVDKKIIDECNKNKKENQKFKQKLQKINQKHKKITSGGNIDIHEMIGKLPRPKAGWTPSKYKYMGAYNPLDKQLEYDKNTGEVTKWHVQPYNKVDEISAHHDICYDMGKNKGDCDKKMIKSLDEIPYGQMPKWGQTARFLINTKQKLGMGVKSKNVKSRRVKKTGKKN